MQRHDASHLHFDFRLEADGVLKSWAVPKGLSSDPHVKRLAIATEDHPLDYARFEGTIPKGQYGGGEVMIWDKGSYRNMTFDNGHPIPLSDGIRRGHIAVWLEGKQVKGGFALTRIQSGPKSQWLVVKMQDALHSVPATPMTRTTPGWISPMLATLVKEPFDRADWIYEPKLDGERCLAFRDGNTVRLWSRNQKSLNATYPELSANLGRQKSDSFVLDGEIVALEPGTDVSSFRQLQQRMHLQNERDVQHSPVHIYYYLFDILFLNHEDLRRKTLLERKVILKRAVRWSDLVRLNPYVEKGGIAYFRQACRKKWEGVIAKRASGTYQSGRSQDWLKFKCLNVQEFVIGGYTDPQGSRDVLGALLIGYYDQGHLNFAGKVGTGFDDRMLSLLSKKLAPLSRKTSPFASIDLPPRGLHWVEPKWVAEIGFAEWTHDGKLRQPRFYGLRDDKNPQDVSREIPQTPATKNASGSTQLKMGDKTVAISHVSKVFYPSTGFTKGQMLDYYVQAAPVLLPHLKDRPVTLKRYPDGVEGNFFFEKNAPSYRPSWLETVTMRDEKSDRETRYGMVNSLAALVWLANLGTLEFHSFLARAPRLTEPTLVALDLDPGPPADMSDCAKIALQLRTLLDALHLECFPKTSGGKGLHIYIPLNTKTTYQETEVFAHGLAALLEQQNPTTVVSNMNKQRRIGKVLIDWSQNARHKSTVAVYSLRAQPSPTVSTPVTWREVEIVARSRDVTSLRFTPEQVLKRIRQKGDLFAKVQTLRQKMPPLGNGRSRLSVTT